MNIFRLLLCAAVLVSAMPAFAHHGAGSFVLSQTIELSGKLTKIDLINPHSWLYFENTGKDGKVSRYRCEMRSAHVLRRSGWSLDLFPIGQHINITASPDRADPNSCYLQTILFANGSRMDRYGQYVKASGKITEVRGPILTPDVSKRALRRPSGEPNISGDWAAEQNVMADPRGTGSPMMRLSQIAGYKPPEQPARGGAGGGGAAGGRGAGGGRGAAGAGRGAAPAGRQYGGTELSDSGNQKANELNAQSRENNPRFSCQTTSIIFDWAFDGPVNRITQNSDTIVLEYGQMNLKRTVFMKLKDHPANSKPTRAGHSIGRWEGDTLVVDTVGFLPGVLSFPTPHSDKLHVVERFTLDPKTMKLNRAWEAQDPVYLKGTAKGQDDIFPADARYTEDRCKDQTTLDYSKVGQTKR